MVLSDNLPASCMLLADRGCEADSFCKSLDKPDALAVLPMRKPRKKRIGQDRSLPRLRNFAERRSIKRKNTRRVATREGKTAASFPGFIDMTSIGPWVRHLST